MLLAPYYSTGHPPCLRGPKRRMTTPLHTNVAAMRKVMVAAPRLRSRGSNTKGARADPSRLAPQATEVAELRIGVGNSSAAYTNSAGRYRATITAKARLVATSHKGLELTANPIASDA